MYMFGVNPLSPPLLSAEMANMHELSIVDAVLDQVQEEVRQSGAGGRVTRLELVIGRLSGVNPDSIRFAFELLAPGTVVEGAEIRIREPESSSLAVLVESAAKSRTSPLSVPSAQSSDVAIEGGQELLLETIEVEEEFGVDSYEDRCGEEDSQSQ